ncbi:hypothetical protein IFM89_020016 [Coptis chinensis]|uniref:Replication protein A 70 kDa DNA-binding subunit B/D first OB fold domain-containing protein n=1 Tax=Coptis chinensis TaxID=261450 RepID=A0A835IRI7_9MAGN|nr:hypothetical protein IFM89_020016 [Coptis chinensis]
MAATSLDQLDRSKKHWKIMVRITRTWEVFDFEDGDKRISLDLILLDTHGNQMHATVPEEDALKHERVLQEGNICIITNFNVGSAKKFLRPVNNIHRIFFKWDTVAKLMNDQSNNFPMYMFSFKTFNAISSGYEETQNATDVIGILISMSYIKEGTPSVSKRRDIIIQNERGHQLKITLWKKKSLEIGEDNIRTFDIAPIVVITSTSVTFFNGVYALSSTTATKVYIDLDIPEARPLEEIIKCEGKKTQLLTMPFVSSYDDDVLDNLDIKTLQDMISALDKKPSMGTMYTCKAKICEVLHDFKPFYYSCGKCVRKVIRKDNNDWYMIRIQVEDSTHSISLVVFDKLAEKLILDPVEKLVDMEKQDNGSELIKEELKKLIGVSFTFEIKITPFNLKDKNKSFTVSKIFHINRDIQIGGIHENVQKDQIVIDQQDNDCSEENVLISKMVTSDKTNTKFDTNDAPNDRSTLTYKSKRIKRTTYKK